MFKYKIDNMFAIVSELQKYTQRAYDENPLERGKSNLFHSLFPSVFSKVAYSSNSFTIVTHEKMYIYLTPDKVTFKADDIILYELTKHHENMHANFHPIDEYVNNFFSKLYKELEIVRTNYKKIDEEKKNNAMQRFIKK